MQPLQYLTGGMVPMSAAHRVFVVPTIKLPLLAVILVEGTGRDLESGTVTDSDHSPLPIDQTTGFEVL